MHASFWLLLLIQAYSCPASEAQPLILLHMQKNKKNKTSSMRSKGKKGRQQRVYIHEGLPQASTPFCQSHRFR
jgi:hypothetical protein